MVRIDVVFVILHYIVDKDTVECVESIRKNVDTSNYKIIIVDNCSPNNSYKTLETTFAGFSDVILIHNEANLGFAKGNNVGLRYATVNFNPEFIVMLNNDVLLIEKELCKKIKNEYEESHFTVLGPMIYTKDGTYNSNPYRVSMLTYKEVNYLIQEIRYSLFFARFRIENVYTHLHKRKDVFKNHKSKDSLTRQENVILHGSCLMFSEKFMKNFEGLDEGTFLYVEEDILFTQIQQKGLKTVYLPDIRVFHKEDAATNATSKNRKKRRLYFYKNTIQSYSRLAQLMKS
jgi:GT2 family glycosyltransferase